MMHGLFEARQSQHVWSQRRSSGWLRHLNLEISEMGRLSDDYFNTTNKKRSFRVFDSRFLLAM